MVQKPEEGDDGSLAQLGRYGGHGLTLGLSTALFAWIGWRVDERLHTGPLFVILGTFTGFAAGFYSMYRRLVIEPRIAARDRDARDEPGSGDGATGG
ncbi:MAG: AtpZ/AtpI family protein [Gemmatimonadota bacterium]|nr:AtpZ/AtpI family protein [Gemmatimonadota bacterium]